MEKDLVPLVDTSKKPIFDASSEQDIYDESLQNIQ